MFSKITVFEGAECFVKTPWSYRWDITFRSKAFTYRHWYDWKRYEWFLYVRPDVMNAAPKVPPKTFTLTFSLIFFLEDGATTGRTRT